MPGLFLVFFLTILSVSDQSNTANAISPSTTGPVVEIAFGFSQVVACTGTPVNVVWNGQHNIQEVNGAACNSGEVGTEIVAFKNAGYEQLFTNLSAQSGKTRYYKCDTHCSASSSRFEISCPGTSSANNTVTGTVPSLGCPRGRYFNPGHLADICDICGGTSCLACPSGQYQEHSNFTGTQCRSCSVGMFVKNATASKCEGCKSGRYFNIDTNENVSTCDICKRTSCLACPSGRYQENSNFTGTMCWNCSIGMFARNATASSCTDCANGKYQGKMVNDEYDCNDCSVGMFARNATASSCNDCANGKYQGKMVNSEYDCKSCSVGMFAKNATVCIGCSVGRHFNLDANENLEVCHICNDVCLSCKNGQYQGHSNFTGTVCQSCSVGMFAKNAKVGHCSVCPSGKIQTFIQNMEYLCQDCPQGKTTLGDIRTSCDVTVCESGNLGIKSSKQCKCGTNTTCEKNEYCVESNDIAASTTEYFCSTGNHLGLTYHYPDCAHNERNNQTCQCWTKTGQVDEETFDTNSICSDQFNLCDKTFAHCLEFNYCTNQNGAMPNQNDAVSNQKCTCQIPNIENSNVPPVSVCNDNTYCAAPRDCAGDCSNRCSTTKTPSCTKTTGLEANELDSTINKFCSCGFFGLCDFSMPFCVSDIGECSASSNYACHNRDNTVLNTLACACGNGLGIIDNCAANMYCNVDSNDDGTCSGLTCAMAGIDCTDKTVTISDNEQYHYYGLKSGSHLCASKQCNTDLDTKSCCNECPVENWNGGSCSVQCPNSFNCTEFSNGLYIKPSQTYVSEPKVENWENSRINNGLFTGQCRYPDCDQGQYLLNERTALSCCIEADKCLKSRYGNSLCENSLGYYDREIWDERLCIGDTCTMQECCQYAQCNCSNGVAAKAPVCTSNNGTERCQTCNDGYFLTGQRCQMGSVCGADEFVKYQASGVDDTICASIAVCNSSQFIQVNHTDKSDRLCAPVQSCSENQFESVQPSLYTDRVCSSLSVCNYSVQYEKVIPTATRDRICQNISSDCDYSSQYLVQNYTQSQDRICQNISSDCDYSNQYLVQNYTQSQNRICHNISADCDYSSQYLVQNYTQSQDRICGALSTCNYSTHYENIAEKTNTRDTPCTPLRPCSNYEYISTPKTHTSDYICSSLTTCDSTQFERVAPQKDAIEKNRYITDRICSQCLPGDGDTCLGCMNPQSCNYDKRAKVNGQCVEQFCTYYSYNISHTGDVTFSYGRLMNNITPNISLQNNQWVRFEQHGDGTTDTAIFQNGIPQTTTQVYDSSQLYYTFFEIPPSVSQFSVSINNKTLPVQQDCVTKILYSSECIVENNNKKCINGVQNGTKAIWSTQLYAPRYGGKECPRNPYYEPCLNYECDRDCVETCHDWTSCLVNGAAAKCGEKGEKRKVCQVQSSSKYNGKKCTENRTISCRGEIPHGKCDCDGHDLDGCGVCGGSCCPLGQFRDVCGICNGTNDCLVKMRLRAVENHHHSEVMRIVMPSITFAVLTSIFTVLCVWACH